MRGIVPVAVAVGLLVGADGPKAADRTKEAEELHGTWAMVSVTVNGEAVPEEVARTGKLVVEGDRYTATLGETTVASTFAIDASKSPGAIDFTYVEGAQKGQTIKGIFKRDGDRLTICRGLSENDGRPAGFAAPADSGRILVVWTRKASGGEGKTAAIEAELARLQGTWQLVAVETDGQKAPEELIKSIRVTISGRTHTVRAGDRVLAHDVRFEIDPTASPKAVTDTIPDGPDQGQQIRGIYRLEADTLISCVAPPGADRPTEFAAKEGTGHTLRTFRRVKSEAADVPDKGKSKETAMQDEYRRFEGTWRFTSMEAEGHQVPLDHFKGAKLVLKGDQFTMIDPIATYRGTYVVDLAAQPKTIDIHFTDGPEKAKTVEGIYRLEGDTYTVCIGMAGKSRPTEFASKPGSGHVLEVLTREKP
jgi:uncharacterized protein (TIGR03067 family)